MENILVLGVGAQGSTVAKRLNDHPDVKKITCADYDQRAVDAIVRDLDKAEGHRVDARKREDIAQLASGVDLVVDALPTQFGQNAIEAALEVEASYQAFTVFDRPARADGKEPEWTESFDAVFGPYHEKFEAIGKTALVSTGSAPGVINVVVRDAMRELESCETINMLVYEGVQAKKFFPFWWSPVVAYGDMVENPYNLVDGKIEAVEPFGGMVEREVRGVEGARKFFDHLHDEAILVGMHPEVHLGCKNAAFKYGGVGVDWARKLYDMDMLSTSPRVVDGKEIIPFDMMVALTRPAPKYHDEIATILEEGLESDTGAMLVEAYGTTADSRKVMVETYVMAPGCVDAFKRSGLTGETYLTGQGGYLFTELLIEGTIQQIGAMGPDQLTMEQVDLYLEKAKALDITLETQVIEQTPGSPGYLMCGPGV